MYSVLFPWKASVLESVLWPCSWPHAYVCVSTTCPGTHRPSKRGPSQSSSVSQSSQRLLPRSLNSTCSPTNHCTFYALLGPSHMLAVLLLLCLSDSLLYPPWWDFPLPHQLTTLSSVWVRFQDPFLLSYHRPGAFAHFYFPFPHLRMTKRLAWVILGHLGSQMSCQYLVWLSNLIDDNNVRAHAENPELGCGFLQT